MPVRRVSVEEAKKLIDGGGVDLVDVRELAEFKSGHLPGARHVPLGVLQRDPARVLPRDDVVFVCGHGVRSLTAGQLALAVGKARVYSIDGGTAGWIAAGLPVNRDSPAY
ncbi:MAG: rhodanese-like domain-containing protein [Anaeromyxobacteraceae bacterium]